MNSRRILEKNMRQVLRVLNSGDTSFDFTDDELYALKQCYDRHFLDGVFVDMMAAGNVVCDYTLPRLTYEGQRFLYPYRDWKFILPTLIAFLELVVIALQNSSIEIKLP